MAKTSIERTDQGITRNERRGLKSRMQNFLRFLPNMLFLLGRMLKYARVPTAEKALFLAAIALIRGIAREGLVGMEVVEVSPPYDHADITALLGATVIREVLGSMVAAGKLGRKPDDMPAAPYELPDLRLRQ